MKNDFRKPCQFGWDKRECWPGVFNRNTQCGENAEKKKTDLQKQKNDVILGNMMNEIHHR